MREGCTGSPMLQLLLHELDPVSREGMWGFENELEPEVVPPPAPPLLKDHRLHFRAKELDSDGKVVRVVRGQQ